MGIKEKVSLRLILPPKTPEEKKNEEEEEVKEGDVLEQLLETDAFTGEQVISDDKLTLQEAGIIDLREKLEVEIVIKISIDVQGKGKDYAAIIEVAPEATMLTTLQSRLSFFKTFHQQRRMQLFIIPNTKEDPAATPTLVDDLHKSFKDWGLKEDGAVL